MRAPELHEKRSLAMRTSHAMLLGLFLGAGAFTTGCGVAGSDGSAVGSSQARLVFASKGTQPATLHVTATDDATSTVAFDETVEVQGRQRLRGGCDPGPVELHVRGRRARCRLGRRHPRQQQRTGGLDGRRNDPRSPSPRRSTPEGRAAARPRSRSGWTSRRRSPGSPRRWSARARTRRCRSRSTRPTRRAARSASSGRGPGLASAVQCSSSHEHPGVGHRGLDGRRGLVRWSTSSCRTSRA